jgi:predicted aspartyl protease
MKEDVIEALQRHAAQLLGAVEASVSDEGRAWLRDVEARGGELQLTVTRRGELWASAVLNGRAITVPFWLSASGVALVTDLPQRADIAKRAHSTPRESAQ